MHVLRPAGVNIAFMPIVNRSGCVVEGRSHYITKHAIAVL